MFMLYRYRKMVFVFMRGQIAWRIFSLISLRPGIQDVFHDARMRQGVATNRVRVRSVVAEVAVFWSAVTNGRSVAGLGRSALAGGRTSGDPDGSHRDEGQSSDMDLHRDTHT
jgi:hypothetical protein